MMFIYVFTAFFLILSPYLGALVSSVPAGVETKANDLTMAVKLASAVLMMALLLFSA
jgi:hypothetical protein